MNPTRSLLYTVNYLQHLVTQYSFELSHWQPRSEQWQSHQPLQSHELLLPHFFSGWMSPAYVHTTALFWCCLQKQEFTLKGRHQFYCWQRSRFTNNIPTPSPFFFFLSSFSNQKMIRWSGRKSAQNLHLCSHTWGESKHCAKQKTAEVRKLEQVKQSMPAKAIQLKHYFAANCGQKESYSKEL